MRSTSTLTSKFTTITSPRRTRPTPSLPLPRDILINLVGCADRFETLHAMAATCKSWNETLNEVFAWLRDIGRSTSRHHQRLFEQIPLPADKVLSFALSYLDSRLRNHWNDEGPLKVPAYTRAVVRLIERQRPELRATTAKRIFPVLRSLSGKDWERLLELVGSGMNSEPKLDAFRLAASTHPNAQHIFYDHGVAAEERRLHRETPLSKDVDMFRACMGDDVLLDGVFRGTLLRGEAECKRLLYSLLAPAFKPEVLFRWLQSDLPPSIAEYMLRSLLLTPLPAGSPPYILKRITSCLGDDQCDRGSMLTALSALKANLIAVTSSDEESLKPLIRCATQMKAGKKKGDAAAAKRFLELLDEIDKERHQESEARKS